MRRAVGRLLAKSLPDTYFRNAAEVRTPKAPAWFLFVAFFAENVVVCTTLGFFFYYFSQLATVVTTISPTILHGQDCMALNPKMGTVYYSKEHSENAQYAGFNAKSQECEHLLSKTLDVCRDGVRYDLISLWGVTNPTNLKYYTSPRATSV